MVVPTVAFAVPAIAAAVQAIGPAVLGTALGSFGRERAPIRLPPSEFLRQAQGIRNLQAQGLEPVLSKDPFTGGFVLSTADQSEVLQEILFERSQRELFAAGPEEISEIRAFREAFIEAGRAQGLVDPRVAASAGPVPAAVPAMVASTSVTARLVAPGVVERGRTPRVTSRRLSERLSGQCAGPQTGITRLRCGRGGLA